ncbi:FtsX-like permease family protein [Marivivens aquimaris]|uniref:FtsX-like permease family protein n=1 Tax=Marivivens aquimaris TaxID=2774876 RepID=UPI001880ED18|nr:ABC transporter permease [Marivivens aquimaris]
MRRQALIALPSYWRRNWLQFFTLLAGLALATALWSGVQAINAEARASYDAAAATLGEGQYAQITANSGLPISVEDYVALRRAGWLVSPVVEGRLDGVRLIGVEPLTAPQGIGTSALSIEAELPSEPTLWVASGVSVDGVTTVEMPELAPNTAIGDIGLVSDLLGVEGISRLLVLPDQPRGQPPLESIVQGLSLQTPQGGSDIGRLTDSFHLNLTAFGFLSFVVGIFIVNGAVGLAFEQRRPLVRTLRALGVPLKTVIAIMATEMAVLSLLGGVIGVVLGYFIAAALLPDVAATLQGLYGADVGGTLAIRPVWWLSGLGIALLGGMAASASALWKLSRMPLLAGAQPRAWSMQAGRGRMIQTGAGLVMLASAGVFAVIADGLVTGFALLGTLLLGAALLLPMVLNAALALGQRLAKGPLSEWFWADTRQQLPGLSLALAALLLAMAANIGVSTMVSSFRQTFVGFLDQRLAAELYVTARDEEDAVALERFLTGKVESVLPIEQIDVEANGLPAELYGPIDDRTYRDNWRFLSQIPQMWDVVQAGDGVAINEQLSYRGDLQLGDMLELPGITLPVVGIYGDYGNPIGQVIIGRGAFKGLYPDSQALRYGVRIPPDDVGALTDQLVNDYGLPEANVINQAGIKAYSLDIFERTFTVTGALNWLTLGVAGFAILMSLLTLSGMRIPQLAPLWALGLTRGRLERLEILRTVMLTAWTFVFALPLGLALAWVLLAVVNVAAFGWRLPMFVFPSSYVFLLVQALIAAGAAALWPALKLGRTPTSHLLKVFANER